MNNRDDSGQFWDIALDIVFTVGSLIAVAKNPKDLNAWAALGADLICMAVPYATGGGIAVRALSKTDNTIDKLNTIKKASSTLNKGDNTVYVAYKGKTLEYVGITNDFARREKEWENVRTIKKFVSGIDREGARFVEQAVIDTFGLGQKGGVLSNKINSIGVKNPMYLIYKEFYKSIWK